MSIIKHLDFDGHRVTRSINNGTHIDDDSLPQATEALLFMNVVLNASWKVSVRYFWKNGLSGAERVNLVCINWLKSELKLFH